MSTIVIHRLSISTPAAPVSLAFRRPILAGEIPQGDNPDEAGGLRLF
jgi:hypothetical protein